MAMIEAHDFSFAYPPAQGEEARMAVGPLSFSIQEGAFCLLTGLTGCGKTTLLRAMKPELAVRGTYGGSLDVCGVRLVDEGRATGALPQRDSAANIGFVMQNPDTQIVCDTVWHEMAFGLENLGIEPHNMRRRVAEVSHYFGIAPWVNRNTADLSGGQKQLLNLAAVLALRPRLILLDEPTAQLDPSAKREFAFMIARVQRELGITVVMATHMPEDMAEFATQTIQISDIGTDATLAQARAADASLGSDPNDASCARADDDCKSSQGSDQALSGKTSYRNVGLGSDANGTSAVRVRDVFVRHKPDDPWVLHGFDLDVRRGTVHAVVGGNGSGKTTLLRTIAGDMKPRRGKVDNRCRAAQAFLPQDPKAVFVCDSVGEELREWQARAGYGDDEIEEMKRRFGLQGMDGRHPYDLSGGQQQNLALAKMLLCKPQLMLLDEPTKGLDARACAQVVSTLRQLAGEGVTIVLSTHDLDVAAACADEATLVFDGQAICTQEVPAFFEDNLIWRPHEAARLYGALANMRAKLPDGHQDEEGGR